MARSDSLPPRCVVCQESFQDHEEAQRIPPPEIVARGSKSGALGLYEHNDYKHDGDDVVHFPHCCMAYFNPEDNPRIFDEIQGQLQQELEPQMREEVIEEFREKFEKLLGAAALGQVLPFMCNKCWGQDEPIMCIFCKKDECVGEYRTRNGVFFHCMWCKKWWNSNEEEVVAA